MRAVRVPGRPARRQAQPLRLLVLAVTLATVAVPAALWLPSERAAAAPTTLPMSELGQSDQIQLPAAPSTAGLLIPVPDGMQPTELTGSVEVSGAGNDGVLEVLGEDGRLDSIDLSGATGRTVDLAVELSDVEVSDRAISLSVRLNDRDDRCPGPGAPATWLRDLAVSFQGTAQEPGTIAEFLPPVLQQLTLVVPDGEIDPAVGGAATRLAGAVAARYRPAVPDITVVTAAEAPQAPAALQRVIELTGSGSAALELGRDPRRLQISGSGADLAAQASTLTDDLGSIAATSRATAAGRVTVPQLRPATQTLDQLGIGTQTVSGAGPVSTDLGVDLGRVGRTGPGWDLQLAGRAISTAPSGTDGRQGSLVLSADGRQLQSWPLTSGPFDLRTSLPASAAQSFTTLTLAAEPAGDTSCDGRPQVSLTVDGGSTLTVQSGSTPPTLGRLAAQLQPRYAIASARTGPDGLADSVATAVMLQQTTEAALVPVWSPTLQRAADFDGPSVLLAGAEQVPGSPSTPVTLTGDGVRVPGAEELDGSLQLGVLQLVRVDGEVALLRQATDPEVDQRFADWLAEDDRIIGLSGSAVVWTGGDRSTSFTQPGGPVATPDGEDEQVPDSWLAAIGGALVGAVLAAGAVLAVMLGRRRRGQSQPSTSDADGSDTDGFDNDDSETEGAAADTGDATAETDDDRR